KASKLGDIDLVVPWKEGQDLEGFKDEPRILLTGREGEGDGTVELPEDLEESWDMVVLQELRDKGVRTCGYVEITSKEHERLAAMESKACDFVLVVGKDWKVIPMENIIAELQKEDVAVMAGVRDAEEARLAFETLEVGVDGVLLQTGEVNEIKKVAELLAKGGKLELRAARITKLKQVGMGDRVCVDTASLLSVGQGMLVGSQANGLFLVHSETLETEYVASRPFRVNAGAVHAYIMGKDGKTKYLSEVTAGDEVLIVDADGNTTSVVVGRVKIEKRPLILLEAESEGLTYRTLLQNAETITLVAKDGRPVSIAKLKEGDEVLVHATGAGRHFGMAVEESVIEK
ncbi:MAG: 3-dehydroquinate synthase II, partial [Candidatus Hydrothermarchaeaceae archaeon]